MAVLTLMYENVQNLKQGQSLSVKDAFELKRLLKSATSWEYRPCPIRAGLKDLEVATNPTPTVLSYQVMRYVKLCMKKWAIDLVLIYKADFFASLHTNPNER